MEVDSDSYRAQGALKCLSPPNKFDACVFGNRVIHVTHDRVLCAATVSPGGAIDTIGGATRVENGTHHSRSTRRTGLARAGKGRIRPLTFPEFLEVRPESCVGLVHVL